jgi:hypothetical protein
MSLTEEPRGSNDLENKHYYKPSMWKDTDGQDLAAGMDCLTARYVQEGVHKFRAPHGLGSPACAVAT